MPLPAEADQVIIMGFLLDEITGGGLAAEVKSEPVALSGQAPVPMVLSAVSHAHIQTRPRTATPDPTTGFWALMALSTNDPDLEAYGGRRITLPGQTPRDVEIPYNAGQMTVTSAIAAQVNPGNVAGLPRVGDTVRAAWFHQLAGFVAPTPANAYLTQSQTIDLIAQAVSQGGGSGTSDLPEVDRTAAASTPTDLLTKTTRFNTTSAAINQTLPAAQPGRQLAVGWDAGTNALTLTAAGSDVVGAGSATTVPFAVLGHLVTLHCTVAGRWRVTSGFTPQSGLDALYMRKPDEGGAAVGKVPAVVGTNPTAYSLKTIDELVDLTPLTAVDVGAQPVDADLTAIAALTPAALDLLQFRSGAWTNRTPAQMLVDLGAAPRTAAITTQTGSYTLVLADAGTEVIINSAGAATLTIPTNATVAFPVGTTIDLAQAGAGQVTVAGASGVTVNSRGGALKLAGQYAPATLRKIATDTWRLAGDVTT